MIAQPYRGVRLYKLVIALLALAGCGSNPPVAEHGKAAGQGERAARTALEQVGAPYRYGGNTPRGFDCSGLVQFSYSSVGLNVPRTTGQLWSAARPVDRQELRAGDLLFFSIEGKMSHVGMYLGQQRFVHAPQSGRTVSVASLESPFYREAFIRAGRIY